MLYLCGGPTNMGSYRKIEVIRGNEVKRVADLYAFLSKGNQKDNILLQEGDLVRIPYYANRIEIDGNVKRKGKYEVVEGETFAQMLQYCGGFSDEAFKAAVTIYQLTESQQRILDLPQEKYNSYQPLSSDRIFVGKILKDFENKLNIRGAVRRPGEYELSEGITLKELIQKAGGATQDVFAKRGSISRLSENKMPMHLSFNLDSVLSGLTKVELKKNDSVTIYSIFDLTNEKTVYIDGNIKTPGKYLWAENLTLKDVIITAGGLTESGDFDNIEIARRVQNVDINKSNHVQTEIIKIDMADFNSAKDLSLMPFDVINIRQQPGFTYKRTVFVEGMVKKPGRYTLQMSNERLSDIIDRCEGFRANADSSALVIRRLSKKVEKFEDRQKIFTKLLNIKSDSLNQSESIRNEIYKDYDKISIDLNKALKNRDQSENMILEDGDVISIERNTNLVKISGEVYFPTIVPFKNGANLRYYIRKSGSFTQVARKNGTLVIYPDGKAKKVKHFLFIRNYPKVVSRSEIFVPQKTSINRNKVSVSEWAVILSSLGIIANVILNFKK